MSVSLTCSLYRRPAQRDYAGPELGRVLPREPALKDPLSSTGPVAVTAAVKIATPAGTPKPSTPVPATPTAAAGAAAVDPLDPLAAMIDPLADPLAVLAATAGSAAGGARVGAAGGGTAGARAAAKAFINEAVVVSPSEKYDTMWQQHTSSIMRQFTVSGKMRVTSALDDNGEFKDTAAATGVSDRTKARLEYLEGGNETQVEVTGQEYIDMMEQQRRNLESAWAKDARVAALRIAVQCVKRLVTVQQPQFYPTLFVLVSRIMDTFGKAVYDRIWQRALESKQAIDGPQATLPENFSAGDISAEAKETCRNWIYKVACIRELLPRLYIETALLPCYRFLSESEDMETIITRLSGSIRGIGNVLVASYARAYLARVTMMVLPGSRGRDRLVSGMLDYMYTFAELPSAEWTRRLLSMGLSMKEFLQLQRPAIHWYTNIVGQDASREMFTNVLAKYCDHCNNSMVLYYILSSFPARHYNAHARSMVSLAVESDENCVPHAELLRALAVALKDAPPPADQRLPVLNDAWKVVTKVTDLPVYLNAAAGFLQLLIPHYSEREVTILLNDAVRHMKIAVKAAGPSASAGDSKAVEAGSGFQFSEAVNAGLEQIMDTLLSSKVDIPAVLSSDAFVQLLDWLPQEKKLTYSKKLLSFFTETQKPTGDPVVIHVLFDVARTLHDSLDSLSVEDERRQIARLITRFIGKVDMGRDLEGQLNKLVEFRGAFANLDSVKDRLVQSVASLAMRAHQYMGGKHTKKTLAFVKSCLAYAHITIPSIDRTLVRLSLFQLCGHIALVNGCLPQAETLIKAAIQDAGDVPDFETDYDSQSLPTEVPLMQFLCSLLNTLIVLPAHPDQGMLFLLSALLSSVERYTWNPASGNRTRVYVAAIGVIVSYAQSKLPLHIQRVDSNDVLYAGDELARQQLREVLTSVFESIFQQLSELGKLGQSNPSAKAVQAELILALVNQMCCLIELDEGQAAVVVKLLKLSQRCDPSSQFLRTTADMIHRRATSVQRGEQTPANWKNMVPLWAALTAPAAPAAAASAPAS